MVMEPLQQEPQQPLKKNNHHILYTRRWLLLLVYCAVSVMVNFEWMTYAALPSFVMQWYNTSLFGLNLMSIVYSATTVPLLLVCSALVDRFHLGSVLRASSIFHIVGVWVRYLGSESGEESYWVAFSGQFLCSLAQVVIVISPAKLSNVWFGAHERTLVTGLGFASGMAGIAVAYAVCPTAVPQSLDSSEQGRQFRLLILAQAICTTLVSLVMIAYFPNAPPTSPSLPAEIEEEYYSARDALSVCSSSSSRSSVASASAEFPLANDLTSPLVESPVFASAENGSAAALAGVEVGVGSGGGGGGAGDGGVVVPSVPAPAAVKEAPETPAAHGVTHFSTCAGVRECFSRRDFCGVCLCFGMAYGAGGCVFSVLNQVLDDYWNDTELSDIGVEES
eukprot:gnl/Spiro4/28764_TR14235_c0_g2_i1.p1 gnl/Spiro4/28764_TR14235_c0_g2~~gnl/Spiro4/28764_TR14235_c0_g2_i1.p1  ORF type:complete len:402 (+),score=57.96 gnl/Spiro4/28764_TR14235_c0_g2_i1:32-1207(+)